MVFRKRIRNDADADWIITKVSVNHYDHRHFFFKYQEVQVSS